MGWREPIASEWSDHDSSQPSNQTVFCLLPTSSVTESPPPDFSALGFSPASSWSFGDLDHLSLQDCLDLLLSVYWTASSTGLNLDFSCSMRKNQCFARLTGWCRRHWRDSLLIWRCNQAHRFLLHRVGLSPGWVWGHPSAHLSLSGGPLLSPCGAIVPSQLLALSSHHQFLQSDPQFTMLI